MKDTSLPADSPNNQVKSTGNLFKIVNARHPSGLQVSVMASGQLVQLGIGDLGAASEN